MTQIFQGEYMRIAWFLIIFSLSIYAKPIDSFEAHFAQTVTSEQNNSVTYNGKVFFQKDKALWHYKSPSEKMIFIHPHSVTVIEPPLEQAIISKHNEMQRMQSLLEEWLEEGEKEIEFDSIIYKVTFQNGLPKYIDYLDGLENSVRIIFKDVKINSSINPEYLNPQIPEKFDILYY